MTNRERAEMIAAKIKSKFSLTAVTICWNDQQAKPFDGRLRNKRTIGFAMVRDIEGYKIQCVCPIDRRVIFSPLDDFEDLIIDTIGRFYANHLDMVVAASEGRHIAPSWAKKGRAWEN